MAEKEHGRRRGREVERGKWKRDIEEEILRSEDGEGKIKDMSHGSVRLRNRA